MEPFDKERKKNERALCTLSHHLFSKEWVLESQILLPHAEKQVASESSFDVYHADLYKLTYC